VKGLRTLCIELGLWQGPETRVAKIALGTVVMSQRQKNLAVLGEFRDPALASWEPPEGSTPFTRVAGIMDTMPLCVKRELPRGDYVFFPFESLDTPPGA
jgi:hypothetical protein